MAKKQAAHRKENGHEKTFKPWLLGRVQLSSVMLGLAQAWARVGSGGAGSELVPDVLRVAVLWKCGVGWELLRGSTRI